MPPTGRPTDDGSADDNAADIRAQYQEFTNAITLYPDEWDVATVCKLHLPILRLPAAHTLDRATFVKMQRQAMRRILHPDKLFSSAAQYPDIIRVQEIFCAERIWSMLQYIEKMVFPDPVLEQDGPNYTPPARAHVNRPTFPGDLEVVRDLMLEYAEALQTRPNVPSAVRAAAVMFVASGPTLFSLLTCPQGTNPDLRTPTYSRQRRQEQQEQQQQRLQQELRRQQEQQLAQELQREQQREQRRQQEQQEQQQPQPHPPPQSQQQQPHPPPQQPQQQQHPPQSNDDGGPPPANQDVDPDLPATAAPGQEWAAIDSTDVVKCFFYAGPTLTSVPPNLREDWATACGRVYALIAAAAPGDEMTRALKWSAILPSLLLRRDPRRTRGAHRTSIAYQRVQAFLAGRYEELLAAWAVDRAATMRSANVRVAPVNEGDVNLERVITLLRAGELSRAQTALSSSGIMDAHAPEIAAQLAAMHPLRKEPVPSDRPVGTVTVDLTNILKKLRRKKAAGPSAMRNEFLTCLTGKFNETCARGAIDGLNAFASRYASGDLPNWFYFLFCAAKLTAVVKTRTPVVQVRPIAVGECLRRAVHAYMARVFRDPVNSIVSPQQVAVGAKGAAARMVHSIRLALEAHPDWVCIKVDCTNGFNSFVRARALLEIARHPTLRDYLPLVHAILQPRSPLYAGNKKMPFASACGGQQGDPIICQIFSIIINRIIKEAASKMVAGFIMAQMDDCYIVGPADQATVAYHSMIAGLPPAGLSSNVVKCVAYCCNHAAIPDLPEGVPVQMDGIEVAGAPIGNDNFVSNFLRLKTDRTVSLIKATASQLRTGHGQDLWSLTIYCLKPLFDHWIQTCYPTQVRAFAEEVDTALLSAACDASIDNLACDPLVLRRLRQPIRLGGGGLRELADVCDAAFLGGIAQAFPFLLNHTSADGVVRAGCCHAALVSYLGAGSFDPDNDYPFRTFLASPLAAATQMQNAYDRLQNQVMAAGNYDDLALAAPVEKLGRCGDDKLQHRFTQEIEEYRAVMLAQQFRARPDTDFPSQAALNCDRISSVFLTALPSEENSCLDRIWRAGFAHHFGLAYSAFARHEGQALRGVKLNSPNSICDQYGNSLTLAKVKGCAGQIKRHDGIAWLLMDICLQAGYSCQHEANFIFRDCVPDQVFQEWQATSNRRTGNYITPDIYISPGEGAPPKLVDVKCMYGGLRYARNRSTSCGVVASRETRCTQEYVKRARSLDRQYNNTPAGQAGKVQKRLEEFGKVLFPVAGQFNEISRDFHDLIRFAAEDIAKTRFQTTTLPVKSHSELIGPISWHLKQRVGMHLFRTGMAFKFDRLYLCLGLSHSTSFIQGQCFFRNRSTYTTTEQILHRWGQVHRHPVSTRQW